MMSKDLGTNIGVKNLILLFQSKDQDPVLLANWSYDFILSLFLFLVWFNNLKISFNSIINKIKNLSIATESNKHISPLNLFFYIWQIFSLLFYISLPDPGFPRNFVILKRI